jgi:spore coat protein H
LVLGEIIVNYKIQVDYSIHYSTSLLLLASVFFLTPAFAIASVTQADLDHAEDIPIEGTKRHINSSEQLERMASSGIVFPDWDRLNLSLNQIGLVMDDTQRHIFYSIGSGYKKEKNFSAVVNFNTGLGYDIGFDNDSIVANNAIYDFGDITYGSPITVQVYKDGIAELDYSLIFSNLPVISIEAAYITDEPKRPGTFRLTSYEYRQDTSNMNMGIEYRGNTAQRYPKKPYGIEFTKSSALNLTQKIQLLNMSKDDDWILDASYRDTSFVRNLVSHDLWRDMEHFAFIDRSGNKRGQPSIKGALAEVIQNNQYQGIYVLEEAKTNRKSLDLSKIDVPVNGSGTRHWDQVDFSLPGNNSVLYYAQSNQATLKYPDTVSQDFKQVYPKATNTKRFGPLQDLIHFIVNTSDGEFITDINAWVDIDNIVDFWLFVGITQSNDTLKKNYFLARNEDQKFFMVPWDFDATFGMQWNGRKNEGTSWWDASLNHLIKRLHELPSTGFNTKVKSRWEELRTTLFSENAIMARFEAYDAQLRPIPGNTNNAFERNAIRWPDSGGKGLNTPEVGRIDYIESWLQRRIAFLERKMARLL